MSAEQAKPKGPDLTQGVPLRDIPDGGMVGGHVGDDAVLLARRGEEFFAIGVTCSHYGGPLAEGLMVGDTVRCPWHHACFSLRTGDAIAAPAFNPMSYWRVEQRDVRRDRRHHDHLAASDRAIDDLPVGPHLQEIAADDARDRHERHALLRGQQAGEDRWTRRIGERKTAGADGCAKARRTAGFDNSPLAASDSSVSSGRKSCRYESPPFGRCRTSLPA